jgi:hypothetical protein
VVLHNMIRIKLAPDFEDPFWRLVWCRSGLEELRAERHRLLAKSSHFRGRLIVAGIGGQVRSTFICSPYDSCLLVMVWTGYWDLDQMRVTRPNGSATHSLWNLQS